MSIKCTDPPGIYVSESDRRHAARWGVLHMNSSVIREERRDNGMWWYLWRCPDCKAEWWSAYDW